MCLSNIAPHNVSIYTQSLPYCNPGLFCPPIFTLRKIPLKLPRNINKAREGTTTSR